MYALTLLVSLALTGQAAQPEARADEKATKGTASAKEAKPQLAAATPEEAMRTFLVAMMSKDEKTLRAITLPLAKSDFAWLLSGPTIPVEQLKQVKEAISRQPIRLLQPGDEFTLPGNKKITVEDEEVTSERAVAVPEGAPVPTRLQKVKGYWRVDATPVVAGRKAADAARKKAAAKGRR